MNFNYGRTKARFSFVKILASVAFVIGVGLVAGRLQKKGLKQAGKALKEAVQG
jgi:hypothetical protein